MKKNKQNKGKFYTTISSIKGKTITTTTDVSKNWEVGDTLYYPFNQNKQKEWGEMNYTSATIPTKVKDYFTRAELNFIRQLLTKELASQKQNMVKYIKDYKKLDCWTPDYLQALDNVIDLIENKV